MSDAPSAAAGEPAAPPAAEVELPSVVEAGASSGEAAAPEGSTATSAHSSAVAAEASSSAQTDDAAGTSAPGSAKRALSPADATAAKRAKTEGSAAAEAAPAPAAETPTFQGLTEKDVGITAYVSPELVGLEGGVIKQRFSDFHVFEVRKGGEVCHLTSLAPPSREEGGEGLAEQLAAEIAEAEDSTGELRAARLEREEQERVAKREAREEAERAEAARSWAWRETISEEQEGHIAQILGAETVAPLREMWEKGPPAREAGGRGGRGRGGRGGRGGRDGGRDAPDTRSGPEVLTPSLESKELRTAAHHLVRELFGGRLQSAAVEDPVAPAAAEEEVDEDALANAAPSTSEAKPAAPSLTRIKLTWGASAGNKTLSDARNREKGAPGAHAAALPNYIHFLLHKTNRETQDALTILGRALNLGGPSAGHFNKALGDLKFAGTKDKRACTVQQVSLRRGRRTLDDVWKAVNGVGREREVRGAPRGGRGRGRGRGGFQPGGGDRKTALQAVRERGDRGLRIGHLRYDDKPMYLGALDGNEFFITLRNVQVKSEEKIAQSVDVLKTKGFINYYGMQRFGSGHVSTHCVGIPVLKGDFKSAVEGIMAARPGDMEEADAAREAYKQGQYNEALHLMPRGQVPERSILEKMRRNLNADGTHKGDYASYFAAIPRMMRTMYLHAYQSYIWNRLASERVERFGLHAPVVGDVVGAESSAGEDAEELDDDAHEPAEAPEAPASNSTAHKYQSLQRVKILTEADVGNYSINDVLIPIAGSEVHHAPGSWMAERYAAMLAEDGLEPSDIAEAKTPEYTLHGAYRKLLMRPRNVSWALVRYTDTDVNLTQSDEDKLLGIDAVPAPDADAPFMALQVRFTLSTAAYATMALREVLKHDTSTASQKALTEAGEDQKFRGSRRHTDANVVAPKRRERVWGAAAASGSTEAKTADETGSAADTPKHEEPMLKAEVSDAFKRAMERLRKEQAGPSLSDEEEAAFNAKEDTK